MFLYNEEGAVKEEISDKEEDPRWMGTCFIFFILLTFVELNFSFVDLLFLHPGGRKK